MKAQHAILLLLSHAALLGAGYAVHRSLAHDAPVAATPAPPPPPPAEPPPKPREITGVSSVAGEGPWTATECRKAWRALKGAPLPPEQLAALREMILREWLGKDLRSALIAWSDDGTIPPMAVNMVKTRFLAGHEEELLDSIVAGDFGTDSAEVLRIWNSRVAEKNPGLVLDLAKKIPAEFRATLLRSVFSSNLEQDKLDACVAKAVAMGDPKLKEEVWGAILSGTIKYRISYSGSGEDLVHELLAREDVPAAARALALRTLAECLVSSNRNAARTLQDYAKLSAADQATVAPLFIDQAASLSFATPDAVTTAVSALAAQGQWETIAAKGPAAIDKMFSSGKPSPQAVSRWALDLPERDETVAVYRRALAARFRDNLTASNEWVASIPEGWHRDQAYAQLAMTADWHHKDAAARDAAIGSIADPAVRQELEQWRTSEAKAK